MRLHADRKNILEVELRKEVVLVPHWSSLLLLLLNSCQLVDRIWVGGRIHIATMWSELEVCSPHHYLRIERFARYVLYSGSILGQDSTRLGLLTYHYLQHS